MKCLHQSSNDFSNAFRAFYILSYILYLKQNGENTMSVTDKQEQILEFLDNTDKIRIVLACIASTMFFYSLLLILGFEELILGLVFLSLGWLVAGMYIGSSLLAIFIYRLILRNDNE